MPVDKRDWKWFGSAGHLIVSDYCRFHMATQVGAYLVSTVGEYVPESAVREITAHHRGIALKGRGDAREADFLEKIGFLDVGAGRKYETMVFHAGAPCTEADCDCGMPTPDDWGEIDAAGYNRRGDAARGHVRMCEKWAAKG